MPSGQAIRERMEQRGLMMRGKTTALGSSTSKLRDAGFFQASTLSTSDEADAWIRITGVSNSDRGHVAKIELIDVTTGDITFDPPAGAAIASGTTYAIWRHGIRPDEPDMGRDSALQDRCSSWRAKPLSVLTDVETWTGKTGTETLTPTLLAFPVERYEKSLLVDNNGNANGAAKSESYYVQPGESLLIFGWVSVRAQTASVRLRQITLPAADIALSGQPLSATALTLRGWQFFQFTATVPAGCEEVQLWLGGALGTCIADWAGVGLLPQEETRFSLQSRVKGEHAVGLVWHLNVDAAPGRRFRRYSIDDVDRERAGNDVQLVFGSPPGTRPTNYQEKHRYAALSTAYFAKADRIVGDDATTDCPIEYVEAAATVEMLEKLVVDKPDLKPWLVIAEKDLGYWEREYGADPQVFPEPRNPVKPSLLRF